MQRKASYSFSDVSQKGTRRNVIFVCGGYYTCQKLKERPKDVNNFILSSDQILSFILPSKPNAFKKKGRERSYTEEINVSVNLASVCSGTVLLMEDAH